MTPPILIGITPEVGKHRARKGIFRCACGKEFEAWKGNVASGNTKSCGCMKYTTHKRSVLSNVPSPNSKNKYKGVSRLRDTYVAYINIDGKTKHIGVYDTEEDAAVARNKFIVDNDLPYQLVEINV